MEKNPVTVPNFSISSPAVLTILGVTGDLSLSYLLPSLEKLFKRGLLHSDFKIVGVGRRNFSKESFRDFVKKEFKSRSNLIVDKKFLELIDYTQVDFENPGELSALSSLLADHQSTNPDVCYNRLYYFATLPDLFLPLSKMLKSAGLLVGCRDHKRTIRVLIEKPFGSSLKTARALNKTLLSFFKEEQIYRIDHYLGKETVQNIFTLRFANDLFEPIWNNKFIDHIEISALESEGVGERLGFYLKTGALKDFVQNHLLNIVALLAMDRPESLSPEDIRGRKIKVLKALEPMTARSIKNSVVRAQYLGSDNAASFISEVGFPTEVETFLALKVGINSPRWKGVPFYLRTGKRLADKVSEVSVHFKKTNHTLFPPSSRASNVLTFRLQPNESVSMQTNTKIPGFGVRLHSGRLNFGYEEFHTDIPGAYERLLLDLIQGDQRLFIRSDEIEAAWKFIDSVSENIGKLPVATYMPFSEGPKEADEMMTREGRRWWTK